MKRKTVLAGHLTATFVAVVTISSFFAFSLTAEINGDTELIKNVKEGILFSLPLLLFSMPVLNLTGNKLAGNSQNPGVKTKRKRMKFILWNGMALTSLAFFLYYRSHYHTIDGIFLAAQIAEFVLGLTNLALIALNIKSGLQLSGRLRTSGRPITH